MIIVVAALGFADSQGNWICTDAIEPQRYVDYALDWINNGAEIIGGCCGTSPSTIAAIASRLNAKDT